MASLPELLGRAGGLLDDPLLRAGVVAVLAVVAIWWLGRGARLRRRVDRLVSTHVDTLARKRLQKLRTDDYGRPDARAWVREIDYFLEQVVTPAVGAWGASRIAGDPEHWQQRVERLVAPRAKTLSQDLAFDEGMSGKAFEDFCARLLERSGWQVATGAGGADQGVDLIATRPGLRVALQCKKQARSIGNGAVQEIVAARQHVGCDLAAVVANRDYTRSARDLAATNKVLLLHFTDLAALGERIAEWRRSGMSARGH
ncbi:MAG: restriction endonuclease [Geminicoccaceae bacterium]